MKTCYKCGSSEETRPYGEGGKPICFDCAMKPEQKAVTEKMFDASLDRAEAEAGDGGAVLLGGEDGPKALKGKVQQ